MNRKAFNQFLAKFCLTALSVILISGVFVSTATANRGTISLESINYPGYFISHQNYLGRIATATNDLGRRDATFRRVNGLANSECSSFESVNYPGHYLRHENYRVKLSQNDGSRLFRQDATFCVKRGIYDGNGISLESLNFPGRFVRHRNYELWLDVSDGSDLFRQDAQFLRRSPQYSP